MVTGCEIMTYIESFAPLNYAETWDAPGLALGSRHTPVARVLCALDLTSTVVRQALEQCVDFLIVHHPPLFHAVHAINDDKPEGAMMLRLVQAGISCYSAHTNLDCAPGGTADALAYRLAFDIAGAQSAAPTAGHLCHGYDVLMPTEESADGLIGYGRVGALRHAMSPSHAREHVCRTLGTSSMHYFPAVDAPEVTKIALFPGSFDERALDGCVTQNVDLLITGEIKHHVGLMAAERGIHVMAVGHGVSERDGMIWLGRYLSVRFPDLFVESDKGLQYNY